MCAAASESEDASDGGEGGDDEDNDDADLALLPEEEDDLDEAEDDDDALPVVTNLSTSSLVQEFVWYGGKNIRTPDVQVLSHMPQYIVRLARRVDRSV